VAPCPMRSGRWRTPPGALIKRRTAATQEESRKEENKMQGVSRRVLFLFLVLCLCLTAWEATGLAQDQQEAREAKAVSIGADLALVRPIGFVALVTGTVTYVITLPFAAMGGNVSEVGRKLVVEPARFTFTRPLGHFPSHPSR
jgi:hypothetical protein